MPYELEFIGDGVRSDEGAQVLSGLAMRGFVQRVPASHPPSNVES